MADLCKVGWACLLIVLVTSASASAAEKPDEYGDVCWKREKEILRNFAIRLKNEPEARGYLIHYAGRRTPSLDVARKRGQRAKDYLARLGISPDRVVAVDGGFREEFTWEAWVVPPGAQPPRAAHTVGPHEVQVVAESKKAPCPGSGRQKP